MSESDYKKVPLDEKHVSEKAEAEHHYGLGVRHVQAFLMFFSLTMGYMARAHLGVTIVAMTDTNEALIRTSHLVVQENVNISHNRMNNIVELFNTTHDIMNEGNKSHFSDVNDSLGVYKSYIWPKSVQEMVLGAFFVGYSLMMFPMGLVCQKWGGKVPLQIALAVNGLVSVLTPWLTAWGNWKVLCACRILQGFSQSGFYPGIHTMLAHWVPSSERGSVSSYVYTGTSLGTVTAFQVGGILGASTWGWPSTFWVTGSSCLVAFVLLTVFGASSPSNHKTISADEKNYILGRKDDGIYKKPKMPWKSVITSRHVWASFAAHMGTGVSFVFFFTQVPTYMHAILKVNIKSSGVLSSLPYIASFILTILAGYVSDYLTNRKIITIKASRVISNSIACVVPAACVAVVSFTANVTLGVMLFVVSVMSLGMIHTGWMVNYMDLAPNFSGGIMAIGNTIANAFVVVLPVLVSRIVIDVTNVYQWRVMMFVIVGLLLFANTIFVLFMSADTQPWNEETDEKEVELSVKS